MEKKTTYKYQTQIIKLTIEAMIDKVQVELLLQPTIIIAW